MDTLPAPPRPGGQARNAFVCALVGGRVVLGVSLYVLSGSLGYVGRQATTRFLLIPQVVIGASAVSGSLLMRLMPDRDKILGLVVAMLGIASLAFFGWASFFVVAGDVLIILGGFLAYEGGSRTEALPGSPWTCPTCGQVERMPERFCPQCGAPILPRADPARLG